MRRFLYIIMVVVLFSACGEKKQDNTLPVVEEDRQAKQLLQGIWVNTVDEEPAFRVEGDSIYYPDSTSMPAHFMIIADTLIVEGGTVVKYPIIRQSEHVLDFKNPNGETVELVKSDNTEDDITYFETKHPVVLNQNRTIKRDTVITYNGERYHCYVQVNPTTYKVIKSANTDEGMEVGNVYYDNTIHVAVFKGAVKKYSHDFKKHEFVQFVPKDRINQVILSDMILMKTDAEGFHHQAQLCVPDSPSSYVIDVVVSADGKMVMKEVPNE